MMLETHGVHLGLKRRRRPKLRRTAITVRWLGNHGLMVRRRPPGGGVAARYVPPQGAVAVDEAAAALGTNVMKLYRLARVGVVRLIPGLEGRRVGMSELRRLKKLRWTLLRDRRTIDRKRQGA